MVGDAREAFADRERPVFVRFSDSNPVTRSARGDPLSVFPTADEQPETWTEGGGHLL